MKNIMALTKRNCLLFIRNKATVFFSFLSSIILIALYFLFIGKLYTQGFNEHSGLSLTLKQLNCAVYAQMIVGVLVINSVSLSTGMFGIMAADFETRKTDAFLLTRLSPLEFLISHLISAVIVSFSLNLLMWIVSVIIIGISTSVWIGFGTIMAVIGVLSLTTLISCSIMLFITTVVKSTNAIGIINGVLGTFLGFLCGIYMPYSNLGESATYIGSVLPFSHLTVLLKKIVLSNIFSGFGMSKDISSIMQKEWFSAYNIGFVGIDIPLWATIIYSAVIGIICLAVSLVMINKRLNQKNIPHAKIKAKK